jgi:iron complex outermembrane receptor protein
MMFQRNRLAAAVSCLLGVAGIVAASAAPAQTPDIRIDVTGSNIKRVEGESALPVEIVTREDIKRTGATTVSELLRYIPSVDIFDQGELTANSPSGSGTSNIKLRGLAETNVLVLLNGRRLPVNGLYDATGAGRRRRPHDSAQRDQRVEILKDGGSAIYGADAVAGVVNFITRKDFRASVTGRYGISGQGDGEEKTQTLRRDSGNYEKDATTYCSRWNISSASQYRKDRDISKTSTTALWRRRRASRSPRRQLRRPDTGRASGQPATLSSRPLQRVLSLRLQCKHPDTGQRR